MAEIQDLIKKIAKNKEEIYSCTCTVEEIDETKRVLKAKPKNGAADIFDVRLQTIVSGALGLVIFPVLGSDVTINFISKEVAYVALFSEIEKIELKIGDLSLFVDASNMNLAVENIDVVATNTEISSDNITANATNTELNSDNVDINAQAVKVVTTSFEVQGANIKLSAPLVDIIAGAVNISGAVTMAGSLAVAGAVSLGGSANGGMPKGATLATILTQLRTDMQGLKTRFSAWVPVGGDGGTALKNQMASWSPTVAAVSQASISNPNVTQ